MVTNESDNLLRSSFRLPQIHDSDMKLCSKPDGCDDQESSSLNDPATRMGSMLPRKKVGRSDNVEMERRDMLFFSVAAATLFFPVASVASSTSTMEPPKVKSLEDLQFGRGRWNQQMPKSSEKRNDGIAETTIVNPMSSTTVPASFATYLTRFLINYDEGVSSWWKERSSSYSLLSGDQQQSRLGQDFGRLAASLQQALDGYLLTGVNNGSPQGYEYIFQRFITTYVTNPSSNNLSSADVIRQLLILAAILPPKQQPLGAIKELYGRASLTPPSSFQWRGSHSPSDIKENLSLLLPPQQYKCIRNSDGTVTIQPAISLYEVGVGEEFGQAATATAFGPLAVNVLTRELPRYTFDIYALFGLSGATGCALTHAVVIPLDVVKTKAQTDPEAYSNMLTATKSIVRTEGISGLLTGAQATLVGYFWYGLSVYPSYAFFKRYMGQSLLPPDWAVAHANDIALIAGAMAAVVASLGLTPLEAARIRVVADPQRYKPLGLMGTLRVIAGEGGGNDAAAGLGALYVGLPSLMTRQVIFGSVKFLAFEQACESIFNNWPVLRDSTATALAVSLVAGGFSGALSSVVSQPADAVLTYVAAKEKNVVGSSHAGDATDDGVNSEKGLGVLEGCRLMIEESGPSSLFRGLGSRSLWAAAIIGGQFLLYDIFRNYFGVSSAHLSQIFQIDM